MALHRWYYYYWFCFYYYYIDTFSFWGAHYFHRLSLELSRWRIHAWAPRTEMPHFRHIKIFSFWCHSYAIYSSIKPLNRRIYSFFRHFHELSILSSSSRSMHASRHPSHTTTSSSAFQHTAKNTYASHAICLLPPHYLHFSRAFAAALAIIDISVRYLFVMRIFTTYWDDSARDYFNRAKARGRRQSSATVPSRQKTYSHARLISFAVSFQSSLPLRYSIYLFGIFIFYYALSLSSLPLSRSLRLRRDGVREICHYLVVIMRFRVILRIIYFRRRQKDDDALLIYFSLYISIYFANDIFCTMRRYY